MLYIVGAIVGVASMAAGSSLIGLLVLLIYLLILVVVVALIICCIMAFMGKEFKLPVIGGMADNWSN